MIKPSLPRSREVREENKKYYGLKSNKFGFRASLRTSRFRGEISFFLFLLVFSVGCGGRTVVKPANPTSQPAAASGPKTPASVDVHTPVTDPDYQAAASAIGNGEVDRHNAVNYLTVAQYKFNHSNFSEALKIYQKILLATNNTSLLEKAQYMVGQVYYDKKDFLPALAAFQTVVQKYPKSVFVKQSREMMEFVLGYSLGIEDLKRFVENYPDSPLNCFALFQLGSREAQSGLQAQAIEHLNTFGEQCPQNSSAGAARLLLQSLQNQQQGKTWKIGVLVPKTGRYKVYGESILNGITLAMEQANQAGGSRKPMSVVAQDTMGDPIQAAKAFQELTKDNTLDAVIGPFRDVETAALAPQANQLRIALVVPSAVGDDLFTLGSYVFGNGMTNDMQGRAIAKYAVEKLGFKRFAILAPEDSYGEVLSEAFQKTVESMGATVLGSETYPTSSTDFRKQLISFGGQDPTSSKENERENTRRFEELKYSLKKEVGKILLKAKEVSDSSPAAPVTIPPAIAFAPLVEGLTNTICPSVVKNINDVVKEALKAQTDYPVRSDDLIHGAMDRLPVEFKGNTKTVSAEQWGDIAQDIQASIIVAGRVIQTNPPNDMTDHPTWDFSVSFEAFQMNVKKNAMVKIYQGKLIYSIFKPPALMRIVNGFQALYLPGHPLEIPSLVSQIHFYDLNPVFLGAQSWENETVLKDGGKDLEGSYFVSGFYVDSQNGIVKKFTDDYLKRFAKRPDRYAAQAYDAARLLLKATETSLSRDDIHNNLLGIRDFEGVSGKTSFGGHVEAEKIVPVLKIQGGKYQQVQ